MQAHKTMEWECFSHCGVGPVYGTPGIMDQFEYIETLEEIMLQYAEEEMPLKWAFEQDNGPKHTILVPDKKDRGNGVASSIPRPQPH